MWKGAGGWIWGWVGGRVGEESTLSQQTRRRSLYHIIILPAVFTIVLCLSAPSRSITMQVICHFMLEEVLTVAGNLRNDWRLSLNQES